MQASQTFTCPHRTCRSKTKSFYDASTLKKHIKSSTLHPCHPPCESCSVKKINKRIADAKLCYCRHHTCKSKDKQYNNTQNARRHERLPHSCPDECQYCLPVHSDLRAEPKGLVVPPAAETPNQAPSDNTPQQIRMGSIMGGKRKKASQVTRQELQRRRAELTQLIRRTMGCDTTEVSGYTSMIGLLTLH